MYLQTKAQKACMQLNEKYDDRKCRLKKDHVQKKSLQKTVPSAKSINFLDR